MSAPHADRDHSEQPEAGSWADHASIALGAVTPRTTLDRATGEPATIYTPPEDCVPAQSGTSHPGSARVVRASEAQVEAALDVLDCGAYQNRRGVVVCVNEHHEHHGTWTERGCPVAAAVADAVVAAGPDADEVTRLRAEVLRLRTDKATFEQWRDSWVIDMDARLAELAREEDRADRLAEAVARVDEALAPFSDTSALIAQQVTGMHDLTRAASHSVVSAVLQHLRAALSGPTPAHTPATDAPQGPGAAGKAPGQSGTGQVLGGAEKGEEAGR